MHSWFDGVAGGGDAGVPRRRFGVFWRCAGVSTMRLLRVEGGIITILFYWIRSRVYFVCVRACVWYTLLLQHTMLIHHFL